MKQTALKTDPAKVQAWQNRSRANATTKRAAVSPASVEQREKVKGRICVFCGPEGGTCDPAHLCARAQGGCDSADCVLPLCRACHRAFDDGLIDLEPILALPDFAVERSHMALHLSYRQCQRRLNGSTG